MTVYLMPEMLTDDELESMLADLGLLEDEIKGFNPTQPRDEDGKWTDGGGSGGSGSGSTAGPEDSEAAREAAAAHVKYTLTTARSVAKELGFDPAMISIGPSKSPEASFTLNGVERKAAGVAFVHEGLNKGRIKLFPENMTAEFVIGCTAHEIQHIKFQTALDLYKKESELVWNDPGPPPDPNGATHPERVGGNHAVVTPDGSLREKYKEKYPVYDAIYETLWKFGLYGDSSPFVASDGVSDYSYEYWKGWKDQKIDGLLAVHETLAEIARIKYETGKFPEHMGERIISYRGEDKPKPTKAQIAENAKLWRDLFRAVEKVYKDRPK